MKALWLRVDAHKVDSREVGELADALGIDVVQALGHVVALGGAVAEHTDDGNIADVSDSVLERWARWSSKRGAFAPALRRALQSDNGEYDNWHEEMGQLVERRARDRTRKRTGDSEEAPQKSRGNSTEIGRDSTATERYGTERDGTVRNARSTNLTTPIGGAERGFNRAELPVSLANAIADGTEEQRQQIAAWLDEYYPADTRRRRDVAHQLVASLNDGARLKRGQVVRAYSVARLAAKCLETRSEGVHKADSAIVVLLKKLGDTSDGSAPGQQQADVDRDETERDAIANSDELRDAVVWLRDHPTIAVEIEERLSRDFEDAGTGPAVDSARRLARNERIRNAYRGWQQLTHA